jgi:hypothetical protein
LGAGIVARRPGIPFGYVKEHRIQPHGGAHNSSRSSYGDPNDPVFVEPFREAHNFK